MMDCAPEAQRELLDFTSGSAMSSRLVNQGNCADLPRGLRSRPTRSEDLRPHTEGQPNRIKLVFATLR